MNEEKNTDNAKTANENMACNLLLSDSSFFVWGKHPPLTGKATRSLWHLFKQYKTPEIKAFIRRTLTDGRFYSVCPAEYWDDKMTDATTELPPRKDTCVSCWRVAKKRNFR